MLLAVDIGNTNITLGVYDGESLRFTARTEAKDSGSFPAYSFIRAGKDNSIRQ